MPLQTKCLCTAWTFYYSSMKYHSVLCHAFNIGNLYFAHPIPCLVSWFCKLKIQKRWKNNLYFQMIHMYCKITLQPKKFCKFFCSNIFEFSRYMQWKVFAFTQMYFKGFGCVLLYLLGIVEQLNRYLKMSICFWLRAKQVFMDVTQSHLQTGGVLMHAQ